MTGPWVHRIDAVPEFGKTVEFKLTSGTIRHGTVLPANEVERLRFSGIGAEVVYQSVGCRYLGNEVAYWRYV